MQNPPVPSPIISLTKSVYVGIDSVVDSTLVFGYTLRQGETIAIMGGVYCDDVQEALKMLPVKASGGFWKRFWNRSSGKVVQVSQMYTPDDILEVTSVEGATDHRINIKYGSREMYALPRQRLEDAVATLQIVQKQVLRHVEDTYEREKDTPESLYWKNKDPKLQELYGFKTKKELQELERRKGAVAEISERFRPVIAQARHFGRTFYMVSDGTLVRRRDHFRRVLVREFSYEAQQ